MPFVSSEVENVPLSPRSPLGALTFTFTIDPNSFLIGQLRILHPDDITVSCFNSIVSGFEGQLFVFTNIDWTVKEHPNYIQYLNS